MTSGIVLKWHKCLPIFRDHCLCHNVMKAAGMAAGGEAAQEMHVSWLLVLGVNNENYYLFFQKVMLKHLKWKLCGIHVWKENSLCTGEVTFAKVEFHTFFASYELSVYWRNIKKFPACVIMSTANGATQRIWTVFGSASLFGIPI